MKKQKSVFCWFPRIAYKRIVMTGGAGPEGFRKCLVWMKRVDVGTRGKKKDLFVRK